MKKIISVLLSLMLALSILPVSKAFASDDITGIALEKEMRAMVEIGVINGYGTGVYKPGEKVNRGQFATFLARALKLPAGSGQFTDVPASSALAPSINAAVSAGIIKGYSKTLFKPDELISRAQMAVLIDRSLDYLKVTKKEGTLAFSDGKDISASALTAVKYMVGMKIISGFSDGKGGYAFKPALTATRAEASAFISRMLDAKAEEKPNPEPPAPTPPAEKYDYQVGTITAGGTITSSTQTYQTFKDASQKITNAASQVVLYKGNIVKMNEGLVIAKPSTGNATTVVYLSDKKNPYAPISPGNELKYVSSDEDWVTVDIGGNIGYVKQSEMYMLPTQMLKGQSYYSANAAGDLIHSLYNHSTNKYTSYTAGKAPSVFKQGQKYYSWDGGVFRDSSGTTIGSYYQYFNMLPARATTNYTAEDLEKYITDSLVAKEALYKQNPTSYARYKDATKKSKLIGLGKILKDAEKANNIDALMVLGMGILESDFGMSAHAQNNNNIFGIAVYDSSPQNGNSYTSIQACVDSLIKNYLNKNYIPVSGSYANGGMPGTKARGFNVRYASDPYWGQKIAGYMYQIDKALGGKDFLNNPNPYAIYETTSDGLNIRSTPDGSGYNNILYTYKKAGFPVIVMETTADGKWKKILSDNTTDRYGYVSSQFVKALPIAK
ncbi:S-layer homology domain-containing protein [Bacillus sp. 1P06AnD]|uniref:S-layer homology domain-containing protein n=1 Tax=Bacillus sp. 1P06AnD TaxID=3132208 RepID=UPI0039A3B843